MTRVFASFTFAFIVFVSLIAWSLIHQTEHCVTIVNERHDCSQLLSLEVKC